MVNKLFLEELGWFVQLCKHRTFFFFLIGDRHCPGLLVHNLCTFFWKRYNVWSSSFSENLQTSGKKSYPTILARQGNWRKWFAIAIEVACASTVVQSYLTTLSRAPSSAQERLKLSTPTNSQTRPCRSATLRKCLSSNPRVIDLEEQLSRLETLQLQRRWLEGLVWWIWTSPGNRLSTTGVTKSSI